ncbi:MAG TPA: hypothetical protein VIO11_01700 [Candidatus Methanoperedens sp.]
MFPKIFDHNLTGTGIKKEILIPVIFSIVILLYSFIIGMLLWGLIAVLQITILWVLISRAFENKKEEHHDHSRRPFGITLIAILYAITVFAEISDIVSQRPVMVLGSTYSTLSGKVVHVIFMLIAMYLIYGFIKPLRSAWIIAIIFEFNGLVNKAIFVISIASDMGYGITIPIFGLLLNIIILVYIFRKADYFRK